MSRRSWGTGSITEVVPGKRYRIRVYAGEDPLTGKKRQVSRTIHGKKAEAQAALRELHAEVDAGKKVGTAASLNRLLDEFLARTKSTRKPGTFETYRRWIETRIRPALGEVPLNRLDRRTVDAFLLSLSDPSAQRPLSPTTVNTIHAVLRAALSLGVQWGWLAANPAEGSDLVKEKAPDRRRLSDEDVRAIIDVASELDHDLAAMIAVAAVTGARRGELCALRWSDLDWQNGWLTIERQFVLVENEQVLAPLKDEAHARRLHVGEALRFFQVQRARKIEDVGPVPEDGFMFGIDGGAIPPKLKSVSAFFTRCAKKAAVDARFHDLRHYAVSRAIESGFDITTAAHQFGHSTQVMLDIYSHHSADQSARLAKNLPPLPLPSDSAFSEPL